MLGAILLSDHSMYALVIEEGLRPEDFYRDRHRSIYEAMLALYEESEPVDVLTVIARLRQTGKLDEVGGIAAVDELTGVVPAAGHARRYAQIVRENALLRRLLASTYEIQAERARPPGPAAGARGAGREGDAGGRARRPQAGLPRDRGRTARGARQAPPPLDRRHLADGDPLGVQRPRRDHRRLSAGEPRDHRGAPRDGQERAGVQHRRERRGRAQAAGGAVLAGDGRGRARPALRGLPGADQGRRAAQGARGGAALAEDPRRLPAPRGGAAVGRRLLRRGPAWRSAPRRGACTPSARGGWG